MTVNTLILGDVVAGMLFGIVINVIILVAGTAAFGYAVSVTGVTLMAVSLILGAFCFSALGVLLASPASTNPSNIMMLSSLVRFPLIFISGIFVPIASLQGIAKVAVYCSPITYLVAGSEVHLARQHVLGSHGKELRTGRISLRALLRRHCRCDDEDAAGKLWLQLRRRWHVGVLNPGRYSWSDIASNQVVVTMTVTYVIKADSYFGTIATANWGVTGHVLGSDSVTADDQPNTKVMTKTATFKGSVGDFFQDVNGKLVGKVWAGASSAVVAPTPGAREFAFSQVTINALALQFPK